jgi:hypothetical protein
MDKQTFYKRLADAIHRPLLPFDIELLNIACELDVDDKRRLEFEVNEGLRDTIKGRIPEFIPLQEVPARASEGNYGYWLYDRRTATWIIGMSRGTHEHLAGLLYGIYNGDNDSVFTIEANAEKYIKQHYGFFVSGAANMYIPIKDEGCVLTDDEQIFNQVKGNLQWRGI